MANLVKKESFSFSIEDYYIEHQGTAILDIDITLEFKPSKGKRKPEDYYEFQQIINYVNSYLVDYPNETDYWEILNTNLATSLITDTIPTAWNTAYKLAKSVAELTVDIQVQPGSGGPAYARSSSVTVRAQQKGRFGNGAKRLRSTRRACTATAYGQWTDATHALRHRYGGLDSSP